VHKPLQKSYQIRTKASYQSGTTGSGGRRSPEFRRHLGASSRGHASKLTAPSSKLRNALKRGMQKRYQGQLAALYSGAKLVTLSTHTLKSRAWVQLGTQKVRRFKVRNFINLLLVEICPLCYSSASFTLTSLHVPTSLETSSRALRYHVCSRCAFCVLRHTNFGRKPPKLVTQCICLLDRRQCLAY
jgi:hypothetical protein